MNKVTIIMPVFNEITTLKAILQKVEETDFCGLEKELILIDDFSTDGSRDLLKEYENTYKVLYHDKNMGKGAAFRTGFKHATGDIILIQDADLEYDPADYNGVLRLILEENADVAYGSRFADGSTSRSFMLTHFLGNKILTFITNLLYGTKLTDMETCYKSFKAEYIKDLDLKANRFDFDPEITVKVLKKGATIKEIPISYSGREYVDGKKITWLDGLHAIWTLVKYKFVD